jgi:hypothetical protein
MSQLSTNVINNEQIQIKELKIELENIPNYLTKRNQSFKRILYQALSTVTTTTTTTTTKAKSHNTHKMEELRKIAILIYKIMVIQTFNLLWGANLKSGTGQLISPSIKYPSYSTTVPIWPKEIKNITKTNDNEVCLNFVTHHLHELDHHLKEARTELNSKTNHFHGYTITIQKVIETYIDQNLQSWHMKIEHQIDLIHYDYYIGALKLEYFRRKPNEYQVCFCQD